MTEYKFTEYKNMTAKEFKQVLKRAGLGGVTWEGVLIKIGMGELSYAKKAEQYQLHELGEKHRKRNQVIYDALNERGYFGH